jgi:hypothetical protein
MKVIKEDHDLKTNHLINFEKASLFVCLQVHIGQLKEIEQDILLKVGGLIGINSKSIQNDKLFYSSGILVKKLKYV